MGEALEGQKTILIAEDHPILSRMYEEKFVHEGFKVVSAKDGEEAYKTLSERAVDAILLDIMLPKLSGTGLLERLRSEGKIGLVPIIALSNLTNDNERRKALNLGAKEYLAKAMQTPEDVVNKIKSYLN